MFNVYEFGYDNNHIDHFYVYVKYEFELENLKKKKLR